MAHNETQVDPKELELSREILKFLKDGEAKMDIGKFKNATLVLGFTGSGKSTLTQFVTGNDDGLTAEENGIDTGEYIINDKNNNVCTSTIESCTIIPTLYVDRETNSGFYDCPGFGDTRSVKHDISVTYFIKKVVDSVDATKLLFVVNYPSVRQGVDRQNFMLLVKNVVKMVKDVEKFKDGIALIVTKVDNQYIVKRGHAVLVSDRTIIGNIVTFLEGVKDSLGAKVSPEEHSDGQAFYRNAIKFVDILLQKNGDVYTRIGLFRRPDEGGKLRDAPLLQSGKAHLNKILRQNIRYVPKSAEDFGYTLSADSLNHMHALIFNINEDLSLDFQCMSTHIQEHYRGLEKKSKSIEELLQNFTYGHETLSKIKETRNYSTPITLMKEIDNLAKAENIAMPGDIMTNIAHYDQFLNFLHSISGLTTSPLQWLQGLNKVVENLNSGRIWLDLLVNLQNELATFDVLSEVRRNQTAADALKDLIIRYEESGSEEGLYNGLQEVLRQVFRNGFEKEYGKIKSIHNVSIDEWKMLNDLLDFSVESSCGTVDGQKEEFPLNRWGTPRLILKGQYVKLSDIKGTGCSHKYVNILALRKVFIDKDFIKTGEKTTLAIMSPTWEVVGDPRIILDGKGGQDYYPQKAEDGYQARWHPNGRHGHNGHNGENGGGAGHFFGIGQDCINCHHLTINANGGKGGAGQDGGDGGAGMDFYYTHKGDQDGMLITVVYNTKVWDQVRLGQQGGNGGNGGEGGIGGPEGRVKFVMFGDDAKPKISAVQGLPGRAGAGGAPGRGGHSDRLIQRIRSILIIPWEKNEVKTLPSAASGSWGANGASSSHWWRRYETVCFFSTQIWANYTKLLQTKTNTSLTDAATRLFLHNLEINKVDELKCSTGDDFLRRKRSTDEFDYHYDLATNGANVKGSIINQAMLLISTMIRPFWKPMKTMNYWEKDRVQPRELQKTLHFEEIREHAQPSEILKIAGQSYQSQVIEEYPSPSSLQTNLVFLEYLVRMNIRSKRDCRRSHRIEDGDYAQNMAYNAYIPTERSAFNNFE